MLELSPEMLRLSGVSADASDPPRGVAGTLFNHYEKLHTVFEIEGFAPMLDDYLLAWMHWPDAPRRSAAGRRL